MPCECAFCENLVSINDTEEFPLYIVIDTKTFDAWVVCRDHFQKIFDKAVPEDRSWSRDPAEQNFVLV